MTDLEMVKEAVMALDSKKATDIKVIKVSDISSLTNYFVIATGTSSTQIKALADEVDFKLGEKGVDTSRTDGYQSAEWIALDYIDVVVHVFHTETREFYGLERLWQDGEQVNIEEFLK